MSKSRHSHTATGHFYMVSASISILIIIALNRFFGVPLLPDMFTWRSMLLTICAALLACISNMIVMYVMGFKASALYLTFSLLGFSISFLWSVFFLGMKISAVNVFGLFCLIAAMFMAKSGKSDSRNKTDLRLLGLTMLSTFAQGVMQILYMTPCEHPFPPVGKTLLVVATYVVFWFVVELFKKKKSLPDFKVLLVPSLIWGVLAVSAYFTLFMALMYLGDAGRLGIAYPIGVTTQILLFTFYTWIFLKEKLSPWQMAAMGCILVGIFAVKC